MKKRFLQMKTKAKSMMIVLLLGIAGKMYAYDFSAVCETGQTLYYNITNAEYHYVQLTPPNNSGSGYVSGNLILPKYVYDADGDQYFLTSIGKNAFDGCSGLTSVTIPNFVTSIGQFAFRNCSGFTSITIPNSVTSIDVSAFFHCYGVNQIFVNSQNTVYDSRGNCNAIIHTSTNTLVIGCKNTIIPNTVNAIGARAFQYCHGLTSITIPNSVTFIGNYAFCDTGLTSITIPNSVTTITSYLAFLDHNLGQIIVEPGNPVYDSRDNCNAIIETSTNKLITGCKNTVIPNTVASIGQSAFLRCRGLTSITIPNSVTTIGDWAFGECSGWTGCLSLPNSVISIGGSAFRYCSSLTSVTIGNSVTTIGSYAFAGCSGLFSIIMLAITPPSLYYQNNIIAGTSNTLKIYVPYESLNAYKTTAYWSDYASKILPMAYKTIPAHGGNGGWAFIASPLLANTAPTTIDNMISEMAINYDLYRFNQSKELEWENYKQEGDHYHFNLKNGQGYLYANAEDVNLIFKGTFNENSTKTINLIYEAGEEFAGWNLVGNPFPVAATVTGSSYYVMNEDGTAINPIPVSSGGIIPACTGIMVHATVLGQPVTFSTSVPETQNQNNGTLQIAVVDANTRGNAIEDKAVVSFNEGDDLGKFYFGQSNANIYFPKGSEEFAITSTDRVGEVPLNFKASSNGQYTLSINPENMEMDYLHLIDNMTGADIDLLATPSYTFNANTTDYASRFRLVFSTSGDADGDNETFAYFCDGAIIITVDVCNASLQVVDVMGRVVVSRQGDAMNRVSTSGMVPGMYVLRLVDGNDVRTQKIVIP